MNELKFIHIPKCAGTTIEVIGKENNIKWGMDGRKIKRGFENPIDNILIDISDYLGHFLHSLNLPFITPNLFTTFSLIITFIAIYYIYYKQYKLGSVLYLIGYFFDCMDGNYARKYNMVTDFGDKFDHFSDIIKYLSLLLIIYFLDINKKSKILFYIISILLCIVSSIALGCQEHHYDDDNNNKQQTMLTLLKNLCKNKDNIKYTKYIGSGTFMLITSILIYNIQNIHNLFQ